MHRRRKKPKPHNRLIVERFARRRRILMTAMGGKCNYCGTKEDLQFHHVEDREWNCRNAARWTRQVKYEEEWEKGLLRLACGDCNRAMGAPAYGRAGHPAGETGEDDYEGEF